MFLMFGCCCVGLSLLLLLWIFVCMLNVVFLLVCYALCDSASLLMYVLCVSLFVYVCCQLLFLVCYELCSCSFH